MEITKEAIEIAKDILNGNTILTPKKVAKFILLSGYPEIVDVFIHINGEEVDPFNDEDEYEENVYYFESSSDDVYRITYDELKRITRVFIQQEIERKVYR